jgi:ParB-like chromosome segregation protein Spo0J
LTDLEFHPVADIFPMMTDQEFADLVEDISLHGLRESIWLHRDGRIIDGRNRYRACQKASVEPEFRTYEDEDEGLVAFAVSLNLKRRHLKEGQRAMVAARIANLKPGRPAGSSETVEISTVSQGDAADMLNVSRDSVIKAKRVHEHAVPELAAKVESGEVAVSTAAMIAEAPEEEQREVMAAGNNKTIVQRANEIRQRKRRQKPPVQVPKVITRALTEIDSARRALDTVTDRHLATQDEEARRSWAANLSESLEALAGFLDSLERNS